MNVSTTPPRKLRKVIKLRLKGYELYRKGKHEEAQSVWKLATEIETEDMRKLEEVLS